MELIRGGLFPAAAGIVDDEAVIGFVLWPCRCGASVSVRAVSAISKMPGWGVWAEALIIDRYQAITGSSADLNIC